MIRRFAIWVVALYAKRFYHHKVYGVENLPERGGILAPNHSSFLDPPLVGISCPYEVHFLARATLFRFPLFAWLIRQLNTHPVKKGKENVSIIKLTCEMLLDQKKVVIFPEGTRSKDGKLRPAQIGIGMLVQKTNTFVIPTYIYGSFDIWNSSRRFPRRRGKTACVFGSPLYFSEVEGKDKKEIQQKIANKVMESIAALEKWYLDGAEGTPP